MTEIGALLRQPDSLKEMQTNKFRFAVYNIPTVSYMCAKASVPGIQVAGLSTPNPNTKLRFPGTVPEFDELEIEFLVDQNAQNWLELFNWIVAEGFPNDSYERTSWSSARENAQYRTSIYPMFSDGHLMILTTQSNAMMEVHFKDLFPIQLSSLVFDTRTEAAEPLVATARFQYLSFEIRNHRTTE